MRILLTGATGTLGSAMLEKLNTNKHQIYCLVRNKHGNEAQSRIKRAENINIVSGDITMPLGGVSENNLKSLKKIDAVLHCAASIDFSLSRAIATHNVNINGTRNIVELASYIGAKTFYHISTSYVAGNSNYFSEDNLHAGQILRNPYEETKLNGEEIVRAATAYAKMPYTIFRPSVIVGNSETGKIASFEGYYGFFKYLISLRDKVLAQAKSRRGGALSKLVKGNIVSLPVTVRCSSTSTINLAPIDWVVSNICFFLESKIAKNQAYHLVNEDPPKVKWVIEKTLELVGIECHVRLMTEGIKNNYSKTLLRIAETMQKGFELTENLYWPYVTHEPIFSTQCLKRDMCQHYKPCPQTDESLLKKLLAYAERERWGRRKTDLAF